MSLWIVVLIKLWCDMVVMIVYYLRLLTIVEEIVTVELHFAVNEWSSRLFIDRVFLINSPIIESIFLICQPDFRFSGFHLFKITGYQEFVISSNQEFMNSGNHDLMNSWYHEKNLSGKPVFMNSWFQVFYYCLLKNSVRASSITS